MKKTYTSISDLIFDHLKQEIWENIPEPLAKLIKHPKHTKNEENGLYYYEDYPYCVGQYIFEQEFSWESYYSDCESYVANCSDQSKKIVCRNPFFDAYEYQDTVIEGEHYTKEMLCRNFNYNYETLHQAFDILKTKIPLADILNQYTPTTTNLSEFLNPMAYAFLQNPTKYQTYANIPF